MIIDIDRAALTVIVREADVLDAFSAQCDTTDDALVGPAMGPAGHAAGDAHVWVDTSWVRRQVVLGDATGDPQGTGDRDAVGADWSARFDAMVAYAASKGWTDESGTHINAHIELRS